MPSASTRRLIGRKEQEGDKPGVACPSLRKNKRDDDDNETGRMSEHVDARGFLQIDCVKIKH